MVKKQPCKLMRRDDTTGDENVLQWGDGTNHRVYKHGHELCSDEIIHFYIHPLQAAFFAPIHVSDYTKLREITHHSKMVSDGTKCVAKSVTTGKQIPIHEITMEQRAEIAVRLALKVCHEPKFIKWANKWIDGTDRSYTAINDITGVMASASIYDSIAETARAAIYATYADDDADISSAAANAATYTQLPADQILQIIVDVVGGDNGT